MTLKEDLIPDFDEMDTLANLIAKYKIEADTIKIELENFVAGCIQVAYTNKDYWINGKPAPQTYIDNKVKIVGNTPEDAKIIKNLTERYRVAQRASEEASNRLETMRNRVSIYQTISANKRVGLI